MPIRDPSTTTSNGVTFLVVFLSILLILTFLFVFKLLFRKSRRSWFNSLGLSPSPSSLTRTSAQVLSKVIKYQPPFLVGFLGSPSWETSITISVHKVLYEQQLSFYTAESPQCINYNYRMNCSSPSMKTSTIGCHGRLLSISSFGQALESSLIPSGHQGTVPCSPGPPPPAMIARRRYSLPSVARSSAQHAQIRRSYSTKARRGKYRGSDVESIFFSPQSTIKTRERSEKHASFSPLLGPEICAMQTKVLAGPPATLVPPPNVSIDLATNVLSQYTDEIPANPIYFSPMSDPIPSCNFTTSYAASKADCQSPLLNSQPKSVFAPWTFDTIESTMHADAFHGTSLPLSPVAMFKLRPRSRTLSARTKRSPPLGPSPLRTMILPESSDADLASKVGLNGASMEPRGSNTFKTSFKGTPSALKERVVTNQPNSEAVEDNDADPLLGLIRELAEEVNDWDDGLFMDRNFKTMIESSQDLPCMRTQSNRKSLSIQRADNLSGGEAKPVLQSHDLNSNDCPLLKGGGQLVSFLSEDHEDRDNIGIAQ